MKLLAALALAALAPAAPPAWALEKPWVNATHAGLTVVQEAVKRGNVRITLEAARFDAAHHALRVLDDPKREHNLPDILKAHGCVAGVNGGYFKLDGGPAGLLVSGGRQVEPLSAEKLLTGVVAAGPGQFGLLRVEEYAPKPGWREVRQAGPYLVDHGQLVTGLEATRIARRTAILANGHGAGALLTCDPISLAEFAQILLTPGLVPGLAVARALNLDGGPSTAFYANSPRVYRPRVAPVRDYLGLAPVAPGKPGPKARRSP